MCVCVCVCVCVQMRVLLQVCTERQRDMHKGRKTESARVCERKSTRVCEKQSARARERERERERARARARARESARESERKRGSERPYLSVHGEDDIEKGHGEAVHVLGLVSGVGWGGVEF